MKNSVEKYNYLRLKSEHFTTGLWDIDNEEVPLNIITENIELLNRLEQWQKGGDEEDPFAQEHKDFNEHYLEAKNIGLEIKKLHPQWKVAIYHEGQLGTDCDKRGDFVIQLNN